LTYRLGLCGSGYTEVPLPLKMIITIGKLVARTENDDASRRMLPGLAPQEICLIANENELVVRSYKIEFSDNCVLHELVFV